MSEEHLLVLLVDDEASLRTPLARYLSNMYAYHVDTAANEEEAWERILRAERPYDVALIDDLLTPKPGAEPEPIGIGLVARIRERCPETECIIFTGWGMDRALEALQAGAYRYLAKPLNLDELGMTIRMAVEQGRLRRERDLLSATLEISRALLSELDVGKTLEVIAEAVPKLVGAEACAVARVDQATDQVHHEPMILMGDATVRWHRHLKGVSLTRQIIETGQEFFLPDVDARADEVDENLRRARVKSFIGLPIPNEPENWGVLYAYSSRREAFGTHERHVLQLLAGQAAIALENAHLFEAETQRRQEAETLRETALALTTTLKQREIFERILSELQKVVPHDSASVQLRKGDRLEIIGGCGFPNLPAILGLSFSVDGDNPNREVIRRRDWFIVPDAPAVYEGFSKEPHVQAGIRGWLGVPMLVGDRLIGMIALDKRQPGFYTEKHARLAQAFAAQAAVAIENARLYDETQQRARRLETLQKLAFTISSSLDLDETLRKACQAAVEFFNADHSGLVLFDPSYVEGKVRAEYPASGTLGTTIPLRGVLAEERLIETKEPLIISNVASDESLGPIRDILGKFDIRSILIVPVVFKGRVLGSFSLDATGRFRTFMENEVDLCKIFAAQVAVAIENARLYRSMERQAERLRFLYEIGGELTSALEPDSILDSIAGHIVRLVGARKSLFLLVDKERGHLIKATGYGYSPEHLQRLTFEEVEAGVSGWVLRTGKPTLVADAQSDPRNIGIALERAKQFDTAPLIVAPLVVKGEVIGTLTAVNVAGDPLFTEDDLNMVVMLANQAAIAIENARLYEGERRRAREAEAMVRVGQAISSTLDLDKILDTVAQNALPMLGLEDGKSTIFLVDEKTGDFVRLTRVPPRKDGNGPRRSGGLSSLVIETGEPIVIADVRRDSRVRASVVEEGVRSLIGVPLKVKERAIGVLFANTLRPCDFTTHDIKMLSSLANQAAVAIENARLFSQLSETKERLNGLIASSLDAVIAIDQCKKITVFNRRAEEMFGCTAEEMIDRSVARLHVDFGKAQEIHEVVNREGAIAGWEILLKHKDGTRIPALLSATLIRDSQGNPIGQAGFMRDLRQVNLLEERLRALIQVSQAITGTLELELDEVLDVVMESAVAAFPTAQSGTIRLYDERADTLRVRAITRDYSAEALEALNLKVGEGIAGWVFQNQQPLVVDDTRQDPHYKWIDHPEVQVHRSMICVPLRVRKQVIGALSLNNNDITGAFQPEDLGLLASFADEAAIAIDNARRMHELEHMRRVAEKLASVTGVQGALQQIVRSAREILEADSAVIWSYDDVQQIFLPDELGAEGIKLALMERFKGDELQPGGTAETVMQQEYLAVTDVYDPKYTFLGTTARGLRGEIGAQAFQGIALKVGDERLGLLYVNYNRVRTFDDDKEATLRVFASHAALSLKNARLLEQVQKAQDAAKIVAEVSVLEDLERTLGSVVKGTQDALGCDAVSLYTYDQVTDKLGYPPSMIGVWYPEKATRLPEVPKGSVVLKMLERDEPYIVDNTSTDSLFSNLRFVMDEQVKSCAVMPLKVGNRKVGVIFVNYRSRHSFTGEELTNIELFAHQAAVAIRNAQLYEETIRRANTLEALYEAGKAVTSTLALDEILNRIVEQARRITGRYGGQACVSYLALKEEGKLKFKVTWPPGLLGGREDMGIIDLEYGGFIGIAGRAVKTGQSQLVGDVTQDSDYIGYNPETRSELAVPIKLEEEVIGVINMEHPYPNAFDEEDRRCLEFLAAQAAIAIENARLYQAEQQRVKELAGLNRISQSIRSLTSVQEVYQQVNKSIAQLVGAQMCAVLLYDKEEALVCQLPMYGVPDELGRQYRIPVSQGSPLGILWEIRDYLIINGVEQYPLVAELGLKELAKEAGLRDTVLVKLTAGNRDIGVIQASNKCDGKSFDEDDARLLCIFAAQAAAVIENARLYEELKHTKGLVGARTALAWMGMANSAWRHSIEGYAINIRNATTLLRQEIQTASIGLTGQQSIESKLDLIERLATQIFDKPITPPLSSEERVEVVIVNDLIRERIDQLWENESYQIVTPHLDLKPEANVGVWVSPEWLRRALDLLIDNAVESMTNSPIRQLEITSYLVKDRVEIAIKDTGRGIPPDVYSKLFKERIEKSEGNEGLGMGLLMVQAIIQTYDGDVRVQDTGLNGTTMAISLPVEQRDLR